MPPLNNFDPVYNHQVSNLVLADLDSFRFYQPYKKTPPQQPQLQPPSTLVCSFPVYQSWRSGYTTPVHVQVLCLFFLNLSCKKWTPVFKNSMWEFCGKDGSVQSVYKKWMPVLQFMPTRDIPCYSQITPFIDLRRLEFCGEIFQCTRYVYNITEFETNWHSFFFSTGWFLFDEAVWN